MCRFQARGGSKVIAIINPASGPDYSKKDLTIFCTPHLAAAGVRTIGYVATGYSKRNLATVIKDIDAYFDQVHSSLPQSSRCTSCWIACKNIVAMCIMHVLHRLTTLADGHTAVWS